MVFRCFRKSYLVCFFQHFLIFLREDTQAKNRGQILKFIFGFCFMIGQSQIMENIVKAANLKITFQATKNQQPQKAVNYIIITCKQGAV